MRIQVGIMAAMLLGGCANSLTEVRQNGPVKTYTSAKSEDVLAKCILFSWQDTTLYGAHLNVYTQPGKAGGTTVYTEGNQHIADIAQQKNNTLIRFYRDGWSTGLSKDLMSSIEKCSG